METLQLEEKLGRWVDDLIAEVTKWPSEIREGIVVTPGPLPYRRLDCDGRALAYVRTRLRKKMIRIDVTGLWSMPREFENSIPNAGGTIAILVRTESDRKAAVDSLTEIVKFTRELEKKQAEVKDSTATGEPDSD